MEQSDSPQTQVLIVEEIQTDVDAQAAQIAEGDVRASASVTEGQNLPKTYKLPSVLTVDNTDIHIVVASEDYMDASHSVVSAKEIDDGANDQVKSVSKVESCKTDEVEIYDTVYEVNSNHKSQYLSNEEDQSLNVITESKIIKGDKEATDSLGNDCNIVGDTNQSDAVDKQEIDESRLSEHGGQTQDSYESVEETIKEIHDNNSNQNNSIVTNAELTKLVQDETEVVMVVETIPIATDTTDNFIVTLEEKDTNKECSQDENITLQEKQIVESDHGNNEIDLIEYSQESDTTIIEVTEIIDTPVAEQYKEQNNTDYVDNNKCNTKSVKLIDGKITIDESINDENTDVKATDSKTLTGKEDKDITIIIDEKIIFTEVKSEATTDLPQIESTHKDNVKQVKTEHKQDRFAHKVQPVVDSSMKKRSVIQDIFDDWGVENTDEDVQSTSKVHDSVEIELKSLLDETKTDQTISNESVATFQEKVPSANEECDGTRSIVSTTEKNTTKQSTERTENQKKNKAISKDTLSLNKNEKNSSVSPVSRSSRSMDTHAVNATSHDIVVPKSRSRHLTSQIASPAEVTEVLKERFREKQKSVDAPRGPDIFFVKKLTQRLSSKLGGGPVNPLPKLIPLPQQTASSNPPSSVAAQSAPANCDKKTEAENTTTEAGKDGNSDNKELLAILEGDIDPDWSILKPPVLTEESKASNVEPSEQSNPPKLDPLVERELALKQLLELPITSSKKISTRKKKTFRAAPSKASKDTTTVAKPPLAAQQREANVNSASENAQPNAKSVGTDLYSSPREKSGQKNQEQIGTRIEESRSGRKRKPTEKAREHEQNTIKRQKVYRGKVSISKKQTEEKPVSSDSSIENHIAASDATNVDDVNNEKAVAKQSEDKEDPSLDEVEDSPLKRSKPGLSKKGPITKRKMVVKRLLRQKMPIDKNSVQLKANLTSSKKTPPKTVSKSPKRMTEGPSSDVKPKKKNINEIDRLLQDEGVVNLLYDVEQPDRKRLVPITKSRAKVMDLQKVQRELKIRKKLVRNAVLRLRTSTVASVTKVSPRSKRTAIHSTDAQVDKKTMEQVASKTAAAAAAPSTEFILPAKIRNAADASIIVRRHSSSSFSSASGSPRVSVDSPEKSVEATKSEDGTVHSLRSAKKRRDSQEEKINNAKKKKKMVQKSDVDVTAASGTAATTTAAANNAIASNEEEKVTVITRPGKKSEIKKVDKIGKQENIPAVEDNVSSKVTTRSSNGSVTGKVTAKSKKAMRSKVTFAKANDFNNTDDSLKEEDELSACLAEAATALSVVNAKNVTTTRKSKGKGKHFRYFFLCQMKI